MNIIFLTFAIAMAILLVVLWYLYPQIFCRCEGYATNPNSALTATNQNVQRSNRPKPGKKVKV